MKSQKLTELQSNSENLYLPRLEGIEGLRAVAAMLIITFHAVLLPPIQIPEYLNIIKNYFGQGVPLFYALSGFVLAYGYIDRLNSRKQIIRFYIRRYFRIAPLFYFMIIVWTFFSMYKFNTEPSFHKILINISLLFGLIPGSHESIVWAGWSIGVEIIFYLLFPIIVAFVRTIRSGSIALVIMILISSASFTSAKNLDIGSYAYMNIITHFPTFLFGVLAFLIWKKTGFMKSIKWGLVLLIITIAGILTYIYVPLTHKIIPTISGIKLNFYIWGFFFMLLIISMCFWPNPLFANRLTNAMGRISFSLYLWHPLIIVLLAGIYTKIGQILGSGLLNFLACLTATLLSVICMAFFSYKTIEIPGIAYGKRLAK